jgi:Ser/Thr protein kinase RdoA (MazF antagonist)
LSDLTQLSTGLPERFRPVLSGLIARLPYLLAVDWPLVPNHIDLQENNIHVDPRADNLTGVVDWAGAQVGAFGMSLGSVENIL